MKPLLAAILILALALISGACATLPAIAPDRVPEVAATPSDTELNPVFPEGSFQFVHSLELTFPGNHSALLMGVLNVRSRTRSMHCVILTVEGLVLFEADYSDDSLTVERGIPPFDSGQFALGLIRDIRLIFFKPAGRLLESGVLEDQQRIYRFSDNDAGITDVVVSRDRTAWTLNAYDTNRHLTRTVRYRFPDRPSREHDPRFPATITLTASGFSGYTLTMTLVDANSISDPQDPGDTP